MFAPDDGVDHAEQHDQEQTGKDTTDSVTPADDLEQGSEVGWSFSKRFRNRNLFIALDKQLAARAII